MSQANSTHEHNQEATTGASQNGEGAKASGGVEVLPPEIDLMSLVGQLGGAARELVTSPGGQAVLTSFATAISTRAEIEKQRQSYEFEHRMQVERQAHERHMQATKLHYEGEARRERIGVVFLSFMAVLVLGAGSGFIWAMRAGLIDNATVGQIGLLLAAIGTTFGVTSKLRQKADPPQQQP